MSINTSAEIIGKPSSQRREDYHVFIREVVHFSFPFLVHYYIPIDIKHQFTLLGISSLSLILFKKAFASFIQYQKWFTLFLNFAVAQKVTTKGTF